jgi:hypothetical protein
MNQNKRSMNGTKSSKNIITTNKHVSPRRRRRDTKVSEVSLIPGEERAPSKEPFKKPANKWNGSTLVNSQSLMTLEITGNENSDLENLQPINIEIEAIKMEKPKVKKDKDQT